MGVGIWMWIFPGCWILLQGALVGFAGGMAGVDRHILVARSVVDVYFILHRNMTTTESTDKHGF
jgi:hypothetical protein